MIDLLAALTLLGAPAAALYGVRCAITRQFRKEQDTEAADVSLPALATPIRRQVYR